MKNLYYLFFLIFIFSCRTTEESILVSNTNNQLYIQKFEDKDLAKAFKYNYYDQLEKNNNKIPRVDGYVEFEVSSNLMTYENRNRSIVFPIINNKEVIGLFQGLINRFETEMSFRVLTEKDYPKEVYNENIKYFRETYNNYIKENSSPKLSLVAAIGPDDRVKCMYPPYRNHPDCKRLFPDLYTKDIPGVDIPGKPKPDPLKPITNPTDPFNPDIFNPNPNLSGLESLNTAIYLNENVNEENLKKNKCANEVYQKLKIRGGLFYDLLGTFDKKNIVKLDFNIKNMDDPNGLVLGNTNAENVRNGLITININSESLASSELGIAKTFIHEMLHAKMYLDLINSGWKGDPNLIREINPSNLPTLLEEYRKHRFGSETPQHEFMSKYYIKKLADALMKFDLSKQDRSVYENLAWTGLESTKAYESLPQQKKDEIAKVRNNNYKRGTCTK
jgi:hypothetical protein